MRLHEIEQLNEAELVNGAKADGYVYNASTRQWNHPTLGLARGMLHRQLMQKFGADDSGNPKGLGIGGRISKALGGSFGQGVDPKASKMAKVGAKIGSALGRGIAAIVRPKGQPTPQDTDGDGQPDTAPQAPTNRFAGTGLQVPQGADSFEVSKIQMRKLKPAPGAKPLPAQMVTSLQADMKKLAAGDKESGAFAANKILKFAQAGYDVSKIQPQWLAHAKAGERMLTQSAYNDISNMLESFGLTWKDLGLVVRIDESISDYVFIMSKDLADLKIKAGI